MRLPRWSVFPALAVLFGFLVLAVPRGAFETSSGAALVLRSELEAARPKVPARRPLPSPRAATVELADFLPEDAAAGDGVDYRPEIQEALDAAEGRTLLLPAFALRVEPLAGERACLALRTGTTLRGVAGSELFTTTAAVQVLRGEDVDDVLLEAFRVRGVGGTGERLGHGLVQITGGSHFTARSLEIFDADADGLAVAGVRGVLIEDCVARRASKAALYVNHCEDAVVRSNHVLEFGGHLVTGGRPVGAGLQLSSNRHLVCEENLIEDGVGVGILCNALVGGLRPKDNLLRRNRVSRVSNPDNMNVSGGIRCANGSGDRRTLTRVLDNQVEDCGAHGIYVENHGGSTVSGNLVVGSARAGIVVGTLDELEVSENVVVDSDTSRTGGQAGIHLINGARNVIVTGNLVRGPRGAADAPILLDASTGEGNVLDPTITRAEGPPRIGRHRRGDVVYARHPRSGEPLGWVCLSAGIPGRWEAFGEVH